MNPNIEVVEEIKSKCNWLLTYGPIKYLAKRIKAKTMLEIGVAYGFHAEHILNALPDISYIGIDPYRDDYDNSDGLPYDVHDFIKGNSRQHSMDLLYEVVQYNLNQYSPRATLHRGTSSDVAPTLEDGSIDLIFVDGDHTYEGVLKDLNAMWDKVNRVNGILCGDDIEMKCVKDAVDDFFKDKNLEYNIQTFEIVKTGIYRYVWLYDFGNP